MATKGRSIRIDDEVWERTLRIAAERGTSATALVNEYLMGLADEEPEGDKPKRPSPHFRVTTEVELKDGKVVPLRVKRGRSRSRKTRQ